MFDKLKATGATLVVLAAVAVGASAVAGAASNGTNDPATTTGAPAAAAGQAGYGPPPGGAQHKPETPLTGDTAAKVKQAALEKVSGGTIERVETDSDHGSPYEAHVRKSDGSEVEVLVNKSFEVTAVNSFGPRG
jgi:uncharacterized membrane protein YkoI